ncbi:MAG: flagellar biosynthesis anti-sigma factor FlgM [Burkholderiales bacterium]
MKISGSGIKTPAAGIITDDKNPNARTGEAPARSGTSASVQLSTLSARMREIETRLGDTKIVDTARVAEIKQAIAEGRFKVNPDVVADRLIDTVRELLDSHKA